MTDNLLTGAQVAERLGVSQDWVNAHATGKRRPALAGFKIGKFWRFRESDIENFIKLCAALASDMVARRNRTRRVA